ncbi:MAG: hypothetical protein WB586_04865 [Chthoniobacterales bacterium]
MQPSAERVIPATLDSGRRHWPEIVDAASEVLDVLAPDAGVIDVRGIQTLPSRTRRTEAYAEAQKRK